MAEKKMTSNDPILSREGSAPVAVLTRRRRRFEKDRPAEFMKVGGEPLGEVARRVGPKTSRVYLTGRPWPTVAAMRAELSRSIEGWQILGASYVPVGGGSPTYRLQRADGRRVVVMLASAWFGETATPGECSRAWQVLESLIPKTFDDWGALWDTPQTTGRDLIQRSLPEAAELPAMSAEVQNLIRSTSGQARNEILTAPDGQGEPGRIYCFDGRFMYGALLRGLPSGEVEHDYKPELSRHGRHRVKFTAPTDWGHVGLLPVKAGEGWHWPTSGTFETWADGAELELLDLYGWRYQILERLTWPDSSDPLRNFAAGIDRLRLAINDYPLAIAKPCADAVRQIVLQTIGALHGRPPKLTKVMSEDEYLGRQFVGAGGLRWNDDDSLTVDVFGSHRWPEMARPEWTAHIWARARRRMLRGPECRGVWSGALAIDRSDLVAIRADALYLRCKPDWPDDGRAGRLRLKGSTTAADPESFTDVINWGIG